MLLRKDQILKTAYAYLALFSFSTKTYAIMPREHYFTLNDVVEEFNKEFLPRAAIAIVVINILYYLFSKKEKKTKQKRILYCWVGFLIAYAILIGILKLNGHFILF